MRTLAAFCVAVTASVMLAADPVARAGTIADGLHEFIDHNGFPTHGEFTEAITPIIERQAARGVDFPVTATTPGFTYQFNFETGVPERSSESLGPVFAERADTVGKRRFDFGMSYLHADLTQFNGNDFAKQIATSATITIPTTAGDVGVTQSFRARDFSLVSDIVGLSATYGVTDRLDVNGLAQLVRTSLSLSGTATAQLAGGGGPPISEELRFHDTAFGFGDTLLRAKYRLFDAPVKLATSFGIRLPTGSEGDFHGTGDTSVAGGLILSRAFGAQDVHANVGVELNADDLQRSRARYAIGASLQRWERIALLVDLIGSSSFVKDEFELPAPTGTVSVQHLFGNDELIESVTRKKIVAFVPRSDVVNLAVGVKVSIVGSAVAFANAIVPVTSDGLQAEVIPTVGAEYSF
ncbi:MAG TPA: transporter [Candidatus Binatia bacterium]|nr:transporter [Candidatus Binatia bacterium]